MAGIWEMTIDRETQRLAVQSEALPYSGRLADPEGWLLDRLLHGSFVYLRHVDDVEAEFDFIDSRFVLRADEGVDADRAAADVKERAAGIAGRDLGVMEDIGGFFVHLGGTGDVADCGDHLRSGAHVAVAESLQALILRDEEAWKADREDLFKARMRG